MKTMAEILASDPGGNIRKVVAVAQKHSGRYVLMKRFGHDPLAPKSALDHVYDACQALVDARRARWLPVGDSWQNGPGPGIELIGPIEPLETNKTGGGDA